MLSCCLLTSVHELLLLNILLVLSILLAVGMLFRCSLANFLLLHLRYLTTI